MAVLGALLKKNLEKCLRLPSTSIIYVNYSSFTKMMEYKRCYKILGIPEGSDQEDIRQAYLKLVKRYHPDSGTPEADANKFSEIDNAFKILVNKKSQERWDVDTDMVQEQDIKHIAPQHRQYLSHDGVGMGTPFQREKQYTKIRAAQAADNVLKHRMSKVSAEEGALLDKAPLKHKIKTKYGLERLVEDLIQESISKGEFSNLPGSGKPLPDHQSRNPYVDFVTHKLNEVLIDNGFTPEWITLQKEIREEIQELRGGLSIERSYLGPYPLCSTEEIEWTEIVCNYEKLTEKINKQISKFNLVVPILDKQIIQINLQNEAKKILVNGQHSQVLKKCANDTRTKQKETVDDIVNLFGFIDILFKK